MQCNQAPQRNNTAIFDYYSWKNALSTISWVLFCLWVQEPWFFIIAKYLSCSNSALKLWQWAHHQLAKQSLYRLHWHSLVLITLKITTTHVAKPIACRDVQCPQFHSELMTLTVQQTFLISSCACIMAPYQQILHKEDWNHYPVHCTVRILILGAMRGM